MQLCFGTNNANKIKEIQALLGKTIKLTGLSDIGFSGELREDYNTLEENSRQKAEYIYKNFGINCFADDSGLEVYSLNNEPGALSARYAGDHKSDADNINLLLINLQNKSERAARFRTVITLLINGHVQQFEGVCEGVISKEKRGTGGFGYDPVFIPDGFSKTFAEMSLEDKNKLSHRGKATGKLVAYLKQL